MSLVAYDSSDESEEEKSPKKIFVSQKKSKEAVKILIPSLKEFEEAEETPVAKKPKLQSGSGLFSLLPPPKNTPTFSKPGFVPYILSSKKEQLPSTSKENCINSKIISAPAVIPENQESDNEISSAKDKFSEETSDASAQNDFFWLDDLASNGKNKLRNESFILPSKTNNFLQNLSSQLSSTTYNSEQQLYQNESEKIAYIQQLPEKSTLESQPSMKQPYPLENYSVTESVNEVDTMESLLNDKEFVKVQGRKRELENIDIIDVNVDDQLTGECLMKNLTEESTYRPSRKKHCMPTQQQKRKHQITYLAFQLLSCSMFQEVSENFLNYIYKPRKSGKAKERENDLKNQWASNSRTRRETQAKYGF